MMVMDIENSVQIGFKSVSFCEDLGEDFLGLTRNYSKASSMSFVSLDADLFTTTIYGC